MTPTDSSIHARSGWFERFILHTQRMILQYVLEAYFE